MRTDVAIIGGGVIGLTCAYFLSKEGYERLDAELKDLKHEVAKRLQRKLQKQEPRGTLAKTQSMMRQKRPKGCWKNELLSLKTH